VQLPECSTVGVPPESRIRLLIRHPPVLAVFVREPQLTRVDLDSEGVLGDDENLSSPRRFEVIRRHARPRVQRLVQGIRRDSGLFICLSPGGSQRRLALLPSAGDSLPVAAGLGIPSKDRIADRPVGLGPIRKNENLKRDATQRYLVRVRGRSAPWYASAVGLSEWR
jgi:hypothetical protein